MIDKNGYKIQLGYWIKNIWNDKKYEIVFTDDILPFAVKGEDGFFEFITDWVASDWEIISTIKEG